MIQFDAPFASIGSGLTDAIAEVASAMRYPVLLLALAAMIFAVYELGRLIAEVVSRRKIAKKMTTPFDEVAAAAAQSASNGGNDLAAQGLAERAHSGALKLAFRELANSDDPVTIKRALVQFDLYISRRLDRAKLLVRAGPALGLMGTLIPLASALNGLARGDINTLGTELETAFAITVVGVAVGLVAFSVALVRERYFSRDLADLEYFAELREAAAAKPAKKLATARKKQVPELATTKIPTVASPAAAAPTPAPTPAPTEPPAATPTQSQSTSPEPSE